jgi:hypothetical protein
LNKRTVQALLSSAQTLTQPVLNALTLAGKNSFMFIVLALHAHARTHARARLQ